MPKNIQNQKTTASCKAARQCGYVNRYEVKAAELMLKKLTAMRDPVAAVEKSIVNGYQGVFEDSNDTRRPAQQQRRYDGLPAYMNGNGLLRYGQ